MGRSIKAQTLGNVRPCALWKVMAAMLDSKVWVEMVIATNLRWKTKHFELLGDGGHRDDGQVRVEA